MAGPRAGLLACLCPPGDATGDGNGPGQLALLVAGATASLLSQALLMGLLPLAGLLLADQLAWPTLPLAVYFAGAVAATLPSSILQDRFGHATAFALGGSLGAAGGLMLAWSLLHGIAAALLLGAFWLGTAHGFALYYRHSAAGMGGGGLAQVALLLGAGALVGFLVPGAVELGEGVAGPFLGAGVALVAAGAHVLAVALALLLRSAPARSDEDAGAAPLPLLPTALTAVAWFAMTAAMAAGPIGLAGCGLGLGAVSGRVAWHLVAMQLPALATPWIAARTGLQAMTAAGGAIALAALLVIALVPTAGMLTLAMIMSGIGWSLATAGSTTILAARRPSRTALALHDAILLAASFLGALAGGIAA